MSWYEIEVVFFFFLSQKKVDRSAAMGNKRTKFALFSWYASDDSGSFNKSIPSESTEKKLRKGKKSAMFLYTIQDHYFCLKLSNWLASSKIRISFDSNVAEKNAASFLLTSHTPQIKITCKNWSLTVLQTNNLVLYIWQNAVC